MSPMKAPLIRGAGALAAAAMVVVALAAFVPRTSSDADRRAALTRYEDAVAGPAREGGFVIQEGLKIGLAQVGSGQAGNVTFQAVGWVNQLEDVRTRFSGAATRLHDPQLKAAADAFDEALVLYKRAAETIGAAAIAAPDSEPRTRLLEQAGATGRQADARFDEASALMQQIRRSLGLAPTSRFPDPR